MYLTNKNLFLKCQISLLGFKAVSGESVVQGADFIPSLLTKGTAWAPRAGVQKCFACSSGLSPYGKIYTRTTWPAKTTYAYNNIIKINPFKPIGYANAAIEVSLERKTGDRFATQLTAGYLLPVSMLDYGSEYSPQTRGYTLSAEEKFYYQQGSCEGLYVSFAFSFLNSRYRSIDVFESSHPDDSPEVPIADYADTIRIHKKTYSYTLKIGYQFISGRFSFDFYAGLGLRYKNVKHLDRINPEDEMAVPRHPNYYYFSNRSGKYLAPMLPLGFRMGWAF